MELISLTTNNFQPVVEFAARALQAGAVIVAPTDTVYGLIANAKNEIAVKRLFAIKHRDASKPSPIFVKNMAMAKSIASINYRNLLFLEKSWPGKITAVLPRKHNFKIFGAADETVALRIPHYNFINSLLEVLNLPLTGTSANLSGVSASIKIDDIIDQFRSVALKPDIIINAGDLADSNPSTIIDLTQKIRKIIRP